ncbi:MAG TPA: hypothetical protein PK997_05590 [Candidatus Omnitrophota bacterium]|nr:hypothetical protein [Candidatus Omnitrophota bacterium]HQB94667.1 hypothetical protein [Candidatus Omnitrophota bacterium]
MKKIKKQNREVYYFFGLRKQALKTHFQDSTTQNSSDQKENAQKNPGRSGCQTPRLSTISRPGLFVPQTHFNYGKMPP